jgi:hypothetical protein
VPPREVHCAENGPLAVGEIEGQRATDTRLLIEEPADVVLGDRGLAFGPHLKDPGRLNE